MTQDHTKYVDLELKQTHFSHNLSLFECVHGGLRRLKDLEEQKDSSLDKIATLFQKIQDLDVKSSIAAPEKHSPPNFYSDSNFMEEEDED
mmetsp:Transcript_32639/g.24108  ORF Transcript_32639/g.24108 Transcript_32639/m.24108 type:complete len:90 (+) Transcript_32639:1207-1476(+)